MSQQEGAVQPAQIYESDLMRTFFAGIASVCAGTVTHPIDTIKIRLQIQGEAGARSKGLQYNNIFKGIYIVL